uniref:Uncharacterized protein n=1 Tax=Neisseria meningitidis alpha275 TaxID=295996 RepID=C6SND5_NEIME|nr:hypothetical protein predicted by Glimmer/Critica [Neisseria meningitidis alpha275]
MPSERNRVSDGILSDGAQTESVYRQNPVSVYRNRVAPCRFDIGTLKMPSEPAIRASDGILSDIRAIRRSARLSGFC